MTSARQQFPLTPQGTRLGHHVRAVPLAVGDAMGLTPGELGIAQGLLRRLTADLHRHAPGAARAEAARA